MAQLDLRVIKTRELIEHAFLECLKEMSFQNMTVKDVTQKARVNRSTFYKHYQDKYDLKDCVVDRVLEEFTQGLDVTFIEKKFLGDEEYYVLLRKSLERIYENKDLYQLLWNCYLPQRDVFQEMIEGGCKRLEQEIRRNRDILDNRKEIAGLYSHLFVGTMMISVRWWFSDGKDMDVDTFTRIMLLHMDEGIIQTLRGHFAY
ncbi:TetR/AcrR family transcriptional regulator [Eubacterium oxidoreducens]|uniref:Transcriptional regulator, TetR family n=1 Tax=Eubacterium oxidoreducens TaxID=1732 RepID=A0A1G6C750_EUBOX|nr:TetR family transcriptional regulator [Eubacterium oxidoreducens]SDB28651.1 transcriptional regulator, TetR family [Eubacterium oxidoreducens]